MELYLSDRHRALREAVRSFARAEIAPGAAERDANRESSYELIAELGRRRWMGIPFAAEHGGLGADTLALVVALEEIAAIDSSLAQTVSAHTWQGTMPIELFGNPEQKAQWLPWLCSGQRIAAFATSPGSQPTGVTASAQPGLLVLSGAEQTVENAGTRLTGCLTITVVTGDTGAQPVLSTVIVPSDAAGYTIGARHTTVGWKAADIRSVSFGECSIGGAGLLGAIGDGRPQYLRIVEGNRLGLAAIGVGIAQGALDEASAELGRRSATPGAEPLGELRAAVVDLSTQIEAIRLLIWRAALERDHGVPFALTAAQARLSAGRLALAATEAALRATGGFGRIDDGLVWRLFRDARMLAIADGSEELQRGAVAEELRLGRATAAERVPYLAPAETSARAAAVAPAPAAVAPAPAAVVPAPAAVVPAPAAAPGPAAPAPAATPEPLAPQSPPAPEAETTQILHPEPVLAPESTGTLATFFASDSGIAVTGVALGALVSLICLWLWSV